MTTRVDLAIYDSEIDFIRRLVAESPRIETGGELLGLWTHGGSPTVLLVTGPARQAVRTQTNFVQPPEIHMDVETFVWRTFGLQVLGLWHSHHTLGLNELSGGDRRRTQRYATRTRRVRYAEILAFIPGNDVTDVRLRPYVYADASRLHELPSSLRQLPGTSPVRAALSRSRLPGRLGPVP